MSDNFSWNSELSKEGSNSEINILSPKAYFGTKAKTKFWEMFKSEWTFKDFEETKEISDPWLAYLKQCKDLQLLPKAGMIIKD